MRQHAHEQLREDVRPAGYAQDAVPRPRALRQRRLPVRRSEMRIPLACLWFLMLGSGCKPAAKPPAPAPPTTLPAVPVLRVPYAATTPAVTADAADAAWRSAIVIDSLTPSLGTKPGTRSLPTKIGLLWDEKFLYVRFVCSDDEIYTPFEGD